jgi:hypothetical protein
VCGGRIDRHAVARQIFFQPDVDRLLFALNAIEVNVVHGQASASILVHDGKGGAGDVAAIAEPPGQALRELRLACAEDPVQGEYFSADETRRPPLAEGLRGLNAV